MNHTIDAGSIVGTSFRVWLRNIGSFTAIALLFSIPDVLLVLFGRGLDQETYNRISVGIATLTGPLITAALTYGIIETLAGKQIGAGESLSRGMQCAMPALGVGLLVAIITGVGLIFLIVPGLIALCVYAVAVPVAVIERGAPALRRSADLTRGHRVSIFLAYLLLAVLTIGAIVLAGEVLDLLRLSEIAFDLAYVAVSAVFVPLLSGASVVIYQALRHEVDGLAVDELAAVFD